MLNVEWEVRGCEDFLLNEELHTQEVPDDKAEYFGLYVRNKYGLMEWFWDYPTREEAETDGLKLNSLIK